MSRPSNTTNDKRLKALLDKQKSRQPPADAFEQEALEGFAMLESQEEALDLKAELDREMNDTVFARKQAPARIYWMAAAGLALLIGISAYFILAGDPIAKPELAVTAATPNADSLAAAPAMEGSYEDKAAELSSPKPADNAGTPADQKRKNTSAAQPQASQPGSPLIAEKEAAPAAEVSFAASGSAAPDITSPNEEPAADKDLKAEQEKAAATEVAETKAGVSKKDAREEPAKKARVKAKTEAPGAAAPAGAPRSNSYRRADDQAEEATDTTQNCYYLGSKFELYQQLSRRLAEKGLDKPFNATLYFTGPNTRVQRVELTNAANISAEEQSGIIKVIKTLDGFRFRSKPGRNEVTQYRISR
jgi:hypothetical protein